MGTPGRQWARYTSLLKFGFEPSMVAALEARSALTKRSVASLIREAVGMYLRDVPATPHKPSWEREARP